MKKIYRCDDCNFEHEHLDLGAPASLLPPIPPCPLCGNSLIYNKPELTENYEYKCWLSEGGCGKSFTVEHLLGEAPDTFNCPLCGTVAKHQKYGFGIIHGKNMSKGASIDVVIGRSANEKWTNVYDRKATRDKIRKESGTSALKAIGRDEYQPLNGSTLRSVTIADSKVNKSE